MPTMEGNPSLGPWELESDEPLHAHAHTQSMNGLRRRRDELKRAASTSDLASDCSSESPTFQAKKLSPGSFSHAFVIHNKTAASPLSKESPEQNYRGFYNLAMLLLFVLNFRLILENHLNHGIRLYLPSVSPRDMLKSIGCLLYLQVHPLVAHAIESFTLQHLRRFRWRLRTGRMLHAANLTVLFFGTPILTMFTIDNGVLALIPLFVYAAFFLKITSYVLVNDELKRLRHSKTHKESPVELKVNYPNNVTLSNMAYFMVAPTLCYQTSYPRSRRVRWPFVAKRALETILSVTMIYFLASQYALPTLENAHTAYKQGRPWRLTEHMATLSVVSVLMWLLMFYAFFHSLLNMVAELLCFGDRLFYRAWWNATDIAEYCFPPRVALGFPGHSHLVLGRLWNAPVYNWGKRHVYLPLCINYRVPPLYASTAVFFISAVFHEILVAIPTKTYYDVLSVDPSASAMMAQVPMMVISVWMTRLRHATRTDKSRALRDTIGNLNFWISFTIVGQPMCILLYYHMWVTQSVAVPVASH